MTPSCRIETCQHASFAASAYDLLLKQQHLLQNASTVLPLPAGTRVHPASTSPAVRSSLYMSELLLAETGNLLATPQV